MKNKTFSVRTLSVFFFFWIVVKHIPNLEFQPLHSTRLVEWQRRVHSAVPRPHRLFPRHRSSRPKEAWRPFSCPAPLPPGPGPWISFLSLWVCLYWLFHVDGTPRYVAVRVRLLSLRASFSGLARVAVRVGAALFLMVGQCRAARPEPVRVVH